MSRAPPPCRDPPDGARAAGRERRAFGAWLATDVTTDVVEQYRQARSTRGTTGTNIVLSLPRHTLDEHELDGKRRRLVPQRRVHLDASDDDDGLTVRLHP